MRSHACAHLRGPHATCPHSVFILETAHALPDALVSFVRLMFLSAPEWTKAREKSRVPKPRPLNADGARVVCTALQARLAEYATTLEVSAFRAERRCGADF